MAQVIPTETLQLPEPPHKKIASRLEQAALLYCTNITIDILRQRPLDLERTSREVASGPRCRITRRDVENRQESLAGKRLKCERSSLFAAR